MNFKKTKIIFQLMLFCISFVLLQHACNDDLHLHNEKESISSQYAEIETAKLWFEHNKIEASTRMVTARGNKGVYFPFIDDEPSWSFYAINRNDSLTVVDIDITDRVHQDYVTEENFETYRKNRQWQYRRSYSRFVHVTNHQTGKQKGFFMTIIPSRYYVKTYNKRIRRNTYLNRDKYLGGYVLFHNFEGQFVNGWEYKGGKIIHRIVPAGKGTSGADKEKLKLSILPAGYTVSPRLYTPVSTRSGFEDDDIIDGGWFDDVIITPDDPDPDWPDPDWPDWPELDDPEDWDDGDIWGDWDDYDDWDHNEDNEEDVKFEKVISEVKAILNTKGINVSDVKIVRVYEKCISNARIGENYSCIEICNGFMEKGRNDQASILYHELSHLKNDIRLTDMGAQALEIPMSLNPPPEIEQKLMAYCESFLKDVIDQVSPTAVQGLYDTFVHIYDIYSPTYYENEINAYNDEMEKFPDVSPEYENERDFLLWQCKELLEISNEHYNK